MVSIFKNILPTLLDKQRHLEQSRTCKYCNEHIELYILLKYVVRQKNIIELVSYLKTDDFPKRDLQNGCEISGIISRRPGN